ncbi:Lrp/AsnC ligand binding domain-containing protein [Ancylobacter sp. Lp-2]|uniref:Lrp/AsnC ligand binding domain-containing protein n=1 Tax=Ancylobacter sp. Lp-2 TaxID=2881339 RepID=UPI001E6421BB|nr:Lrp/AsnC ligand binding domain-containing protein [Ancylobacter sp. Lp-2]MCB4768545.1 Lrp/AsnC ligand binding domain-containing protein [Ancylobacter sp. Lp-2]
MARKSLTHHPLDAIDRKILSILQVEGRITNNELAQRVGLPPTSMSDRIRRLVANGYVTGFSARLEPRLLGFDLLVFVEVLLDKTTTDVFAKFAREVRAAPEVLECHMVAGGFDYLIKTRQRSMEEFRRFLGEVMLSWTGVQETRTYVVMEEIKTDNVLQILP